MKIKVPVLPGETVKANIDGKLMEFVVTEYIYVSNKMCIVILFFWKIIFSQRHKLENG